uniref:Uncharacterized protein n=1 Tax=Ixodes scapularis TaxID=6945 RepID=A0A4D5RCH1_IXOSC
MKFLCRRSPAVCFSSRLLFLPFVSSLTHLPLGGFYMCYLTLYICTVTDFSHVQATITDKSTTSISLR